MVSKKSFTDTGSTTLTPSDAKPGSGASGEAKHRPNRIRLLAWLPSPMECDTRIWCGILLNMNYGVYI